MNDGDAPTRLGGGVMKVLGDSEARGRRDFTGVDVADEATEDGLDSAEKDRRGMEDDEEPLETVRDCGNVNDESSSSSSNGDMTRAGVFV